MKLHYGMTVNEKGHLTLSGCDTVELAKRYGTPLYVLDENALRKNCKDALSAMRKYFPQGKVMYASKALNCKAVLRIVQSEGLGIDTVSGGELYTALSAGIDPENIELHGNGKTEDEIRMAVKNGIYSIIADGFDELEVIENVCREENKKIKISLRLRPNIDVHAHKAVQTARMDCKFGFGMEEAILAAEKVTNSEYMILNGIHCHIGSQIFEEEPFGILCGHLVDFACKVREKCGITLKEFNCGGGYGVRYTDDDTPKSFETFIKVIHGSLSQLCEKTGFPMPNVIIEPGRSVVGEAGTTLYTVNGIKEIPNIRTYCNCDGGMFENVRTAMYGSKYDAVCANKMNEEHIHPVSIAGKCCESGDMITFDTPMPSLLRGDVLAVFTTGAYNYSMASNYNRNAVPAMILVKDGQSCEIVKRQTYEYITLNDVLPEYLK